MVPWALERLPSLMLRQVPCSSSNPKPANCGENCVHFNECLAAIQFVKPLALLPFLRLLSPFLFLGVSVISFRIQTHFELSPTSARACRIAADFVFHVRINLVIVEGSSWAAVRARWVLDPRGAALAGAAARCAAADQPPGSTTLPDPLRRTKCRLFRRVVCVAFAYLVLSRLMLCTAWGRGLPYVGNSTGMYGLIAALQAASTCFLNSGMPPPLVTRH